MTPSLFPRGDEDVALSIEAALVSDGVKLVHNMQYDEVKTVSVADPVSMVVIGSDGHEKIEVECDLLLVAAGRTPNTSNLGLEDAGIDYDRGGIIVDDLLHSSNPNVLAVGDCVSGVPRLTHMSGEMAKVAVQNGIFNDSWKLSSLVVPATMYTEPEYASVGRTDTEGDDVDVFMASIEHNDRSILEGEEHPGFVKVLCAKGTDQIVGAIIVSSRAGEMINEIVLAMSQGIGLTGIGRSIHSYPTLGESVMGAGLSYIRSQWKILK
uniref:Pyridine nucleotide-disulphide oxidoreductase dimerisation domain-containing protein n=1 Tax=Leptocylindrus danicus TaxID=163516 RepID=A0A7S2KE09_9STRA